MSAKDFGYFLLFIGVVWIALIIPFDSTLFRNSLTLPIGLIIFGSLFVVKGLLKLEVIDKPLGYAFLVFIILMVRSNTFLIFTPWDLMHYELTESYANSFNITNASPLSLACDACSMSLLSSSDAQVKTSMKHAVNSRPTIDFKNDSLSINLKHDVPTGMSGALINYSIPDGAGEVQIKAGVGSIDINLVNAENNNRLNISTGVGSINLTNFKTIGFSDTFIDSGVGSVKILIDGVTGDKTIDISTGVGSIDLFIKLGLIIRFELNTGIGSVDNDYGGASLAEYSNATNRLLIKAHTGIGSIDVKLTN